MTNARRNLTRLRRILYILGLVVGLLVLAHAPFVRRALRSRLETSIENRLGSRAAIEALDYRLWLGEIRASGVVLTAPSWSARVSEVLVTIAPWSGISVRVDSPEVRVTRAAPPSEGASRFSFPSIVLRSHVTVENGSFAVDERLELDSIQAELVPGLLGASAELRIARARVQGPAGSIPFGPLTGRFRLGSEDVEIGELRIEKSGSWVEGSGRLPALSPLVAELQYQLHLDAALLRELDPRLELTGELEDEGTLSFRADGSVHAEGLCRSEGLRFDSVEAALRAPWQLERGIVTVRDANVEAFGGTASIDAVLDLAAETESAQVSFEGVDAALASPWIASRASGALTVSLERFDFTTTKGEGRVSLTPAARSPDRVFPVRGEARVRITGQRVEFDARNLTTRSLEVEASGAWQDRLSAHYRARVRDLADAGELYEALDIDPLPFPVTGALLLEGDATETATGLGTRATVTSEQLHLGRVPFDLAGGVSWREGRLELDRMRLTGEATGAVETRDLVLEGGIPTHPRSGPFQLSARARDLDLAWISELTPAAITGRLTGALSLHGDFETPALVASFEAADLALEGLVTGALQGEAHLEGLFGSITGEATLRGKDVLVRDVPFPGETAHLTFEGSDVGFTSQLDDGRELMTGRLSLVAPYALEAEIPLASLPFLEARELFPRLRDAGTELDLRGTARVTADLLDLESLRYRIEVESVFGFYRGLVLGATSPFTLEGDRERFEVRDLTLVGEDTAIGVEGVVPLSRDGGVFLHARGATRLELLRPWAPSLEPAGRADVEVRVEGALPDPWIRGAIEIEEASALVSGIRIENVLAEVVWTDDALSVSTLSGEVLGGTFRMRDSSFPSGLREGGAVRASFEAVDLDPLRLLPEGSELLAETDARIGLRGEVRGEGLDPKTWNGEGSLERVEAHARGVLLENESSARWSLEGGTLSLQSLSLGGGATSLSIDAEARPFDDRLSWSAHATGRIDHSVASVLLEDLGWSFTGATELDVRAGQGPGPFVIEGRGSFSNARLVIRDPAIAFTNVAGEVELTGDRITLTSLRADAGGGRVDADGTITLEAGAIDRIDFHARALSVRLNYPEGLRSEVDGEFGLAGNPDRLQLSGEVSLSRALFSRDISVESELLQSLSRVRKLSTEETFASRVSLDLRVRATDAFRVDNNLARMEASVNLTVGGTLAAPELDGIASVRGGGNFRFGNQSYTVEQGRIQLRNYPNDPPVLDITAVTSVSEYDIRLALRGPTDDLITELSSPSNPELSRADVASLLLFGRTLNDISGEGRTVVGERMVSYLGASLADLARLGIGEALPFQIVTVEPSLIAGEADPGARFTIGARFTNALSVVYSVSLDDADNQIWVVEQQMPRRTRAQMIRDPQNEFTFGVAQELRLHLRGRGERAKTTQPTVTGVGVTLTDRLPEDLENAVRRRVRIAPGVEFDYWKAWEDTERIRKELHERSYLEATVDLTTSPAATGGIYVNFSVDAGPPVRFAWEGDVPEGLRKDLARAWTGGSSDAFLTADLTTLAEGELYERGYFVAEVDVSTALSNGERVVTVRIEPGPKGESVRVSFPGNRSIADSVLLRALPKPRSAEFHELLAAKRPRLKQLLTLEYAARGFVAASIGDPDLSFDPTTRELAVAIPADEGPRFLVDAIELEGVEGLDEATIRSAIALRAGEPFRVDAFVDDRSAIASLYRERGFPDVGVEATILDRPTPGELGVRFRIDEGPRVTVGSVRVAGNETTRESVIRREVTLEPGEPLRWSEVNETQKRLYDLGVFQSAEVVVGDEGAGGPVRDVTVEVAEMPGLDLDYGARFSTEGFFQVLGELRAPNLFGRAQHAGFRALVGSERKSFRLTYHTPYFTKYRLDTDFWLERGFLDQGPAPLDGEETLPFTERSWTFTAQQTRILTRQLNVQWSYTLRRSVFTKDDPFFGPVTELTRTATITGAVVGDYRDSVVRPARGTFWNATLQLAPKALGSDLRFEKLYGQLATFVSLGRGLVWAGAYRFGAANSHGSFLDVDQGFRTGGPNSVRGFAPASLGPVLDGGTIYGGNGLLVFNQEMRFPIAWRFRGVGFYDAGNAFAQTSDIALSELKQSAGAGLRLELPFGLLRFDLARAFGRSSADNPWRFVFSLGHAF